MLIFINLINLFHLLCYLLIMSELSLEDLVHHTYETGKRHELLDYFHQGTQAHKCGYQYIFFCKK